MLQNRSEITNLGNCETKRKVKLSNIFKTLKHGKSAAKTKKQKNANKNSVFSGPKVLLFYPKSVPKTGNQLASYNEEKLWKLSVVTYNSLTSLVILN